MLKDMTWYEIGLALLIALFLAVVMVGVITAIVYLLPIADRLKPHVLGILGIVSIGLGYYALRRMPPNTQQSTPTTPRPITQFIEVCNGTKEINKNLVHSPVMPNRSMARSNPPSIKKPKTIIAFKKEPPILTPLLKLFRDRHHVL